MNDTQKRERILQRNNTVLKIMQNDKKQALILDRLFQIKSPLNAPAEVVSVMKELGQVCKQRFDLERTLKATNQLIN